MVVEEGNLTVLRRWILSLRASIELAGVQENSDAGEDIVKTAAKTAVKSKGESVAFRKTGEQLKEFKRIYSSLEKQTYEAAAIEADRIEAEARLDVESGFWSDRQEMPTGKR